MRVVAYLFIIHIFLTETISGQVTTTPVASKVEIVDNMPFDSTINFLGANVKAYIGQELYLSGKAETLRRYGYEGFYVDYTKETMANKSNVYKCCDGFNSMYNELAGKYFIVLDVLKHPKASQSDFLYGKKYFFKLQEKSGGDIVYFQYSSEYEHSFPFIIVGYFNKLKANSLGQVYVVRGKNWLKAGTMTDIKTGLPVTEFEPGNAWKVVDLTVDEEYYSLSYLIQNKEGETVSLPVETAKKEHWVFREEVAKRYELLYGENIWSNIIEGTVKIGMTNEMCKLSWGTPERINETITAGKVTEQWVYKNNFLYFENGTLTAIQ